MITARRPKIVQVRWRDSATNSGTFEMKEAAAHTLMRDDVVGFLVGEHEDRIVLAFELFEEDGSCRRTIAIPRVNIEEVTELMPHKSGRKSYPSSKGHPGKKKSKKG